MGLSHRRNMCNPASFILSQDRVYWSKSTDSHSDIIAEFGLNDDKNVMLSRLLRVEIVFPDGDFTKPLDEWKFHTDQDILPSWYDAVRDEERTRKALVAWKKAKVFTEGSVNLCEGEFFVSGNSTYGNVDKDATCHVRDGASITALGRASVDVQLGAYVAAYDFTFVTAYDNTTVSAHGNSRVRAYGTASVDATDDTRIVSWGKSRVTVSARAHVGAHSVSVVKAFGKATVDACDETKVTASESAFVRVSDHVSVDAKGHAIVEVYGCDSLVLSEDATAIILGGNPKIVVKDNAVCVDKRTSIPNVLTATSAM